MTTVIFGGTAAYHLKLEEHAQVGERRVIDTPFGDSAPFVQLTANGKTVWFSSRHGEDGLQRTAAFVNHRANIWAAQALEADAILSWNGVGAIAPGLSVGQAVVVDDVLDMTRARIESFQQSAVSGQLDAKHPLPPRSLESLAASPLSREGEINRPFDADLRQRLIAACGETGIPYATHGTYVCTEGPRLETAAEISMYGWGDAAVVGMTLCPEVWLAAELGIPYASVCIITNMATGRWHFENKRDFGVGVAVKGLGITLAAS